MLRAGAGQFCSKRPATRWWLPWPMARVCGQRSRRGMPMSRSVTFRYFPPFTHRRRAARDPRRTPGASGHSRTAVLAVCRAALMFRELLNRSRWRRGVSVEGSSIASSPVHGRARPSRSGGTVLDPTVIDAMLTASEAHRPLDCAHAPRTRGAAPDRRGAVRRGGLRRAAPQRQRHHQAHHRHFRQTRASVQPRGQPPACWPSSLTSTPDGIPSDAVPDARAVASQDSPLSCGRVDRQCRLASPGG